RLFVLVSALALAFSLLPATAGAADGLTYEQFENGTKTDNVEVLKRIGFTGATEIDADGRYAYVGQFSGKYDRNTIDQGGLYIIDMVGDEDTEPFTVVSKLECTGTDNYIRLMDPAVFNPDEPEKQYVVMAHHGNRCNARDLRNDPNTQAGYGAFNGIMVIDVTDRANPVIVDSIGHESAHTVMPHPTRPYLYILPGGTANGINTGRRRISPTGIIDASNPTDLKYITAFQHNAQGCHDLGWTPDGDYAYCAGIGEIQVWDVSGDRIENPLVVNTIVNPAIQFAHNAVLSDDGKYLLINDEAFGFHTCRGDAADLYGSLWIYDVSIPNLPILAGRIEPPGHPKGSGQVNTAGWVTEWCAAHNYNFVPGTYTVVASWFGGGMTAHDITDPLNPELVAQYMPGGDSVMWSAHYYNGYVLTGDMGLGVDILDIPELREAEAAAAATGAPEGAGSGDAMFGAGLSLGAPRIDRTAELVPAVLPPRPVVERGIGESGFCVVPGNRNT
ncbi:MAG TPA: hypothetical protein VM307_10130, partial [Egibacteraceae bacterium]|nr:hypothetical protein [Egibacteraceae bacterium]